MSLSHSSIADALALLTIICLAGLYFKNRRKLPLPPGPKGLPFIGNLLDLSPKNAHAKYYEWSKKHGDVISLALPGTTILVVNSAEAAKKLLDKQAATCSDRPSLPFAELYVHHLLMKSLV